MPSLPMPDIPPGKLRELLEALHHEHKRSGVPGVRRIANGTRFSSTAVHNLFTQAHQRAPNQAILFDVVAELLKMRSWRISDEEREKTLDRFDELWMAALEQPFDDDDAGTAFTSHWVPHGAEHWLGGPMEQRRLHAGLVDGARRATDTRDRRGARATA